MPPRNAIAQTASRSLPPGSHRGRVDGDIDGNGGPAKRSSHTAVWTGTEWIVWGSYAGGPHLLTGGGYAPYVGDLGVLEIKGIYTQPPGSNALADRRCGETLTFADDLGLPGPSGVSFSLVSGVTGGSEGSLSASSSGPTPNANPCP